MIRNAYGKVNLSLDVVGLREDGYHQLDMLMAPIDLYDTLEINISDIDAFSCNIRMPWDDRNLVYRAIRLFEDKYDLHCRYEVKLEKGIPSQAGLGGGSSDAACCLNMLYELHGIEESDEEKIALAKKLGADVPFFLYTRASRVKGIGEQLEFVQLPEDLEVLLVKPDKGISTREAFELLDTMEYSHPNIDEIAGDVEHSGLENSLEKSAFVLLPEIRTVKDICLKHGFRQVVMSGSGSTVLVLLKKDEDTSKLEAELRRKYVFVRRVKLI